MTATLANHQRPVDAFAELQQNIYLDMCGGRISMSIRRIWYKWVCRCTRGGMVGNEFLGQVSDWPKDAVDHPKVRRSVNWWRGLGSQNVRIHGWPRSMNRLVLASVIALVLFAFANLVPDFYTPVRVKRARYC